MSIDGPCSMRHELASSIIHNSVSVFLDQPQKLFKFKKLGGDTHHESKATDAVCLRPHSPQCKWHRSRKETRSS